MYQLSANGADYECLNITNNNVSYDHTNHNPEAVFKQRCIIASL